MNLDILDHVGKNRNNNKHTQNITNNSKHTYRNQLGQLRALNRPVIPKINNIDGKLVVSSRAIAEELGKRHSDVLTQIDTILENENSRSLIIPSVYKAEGQTRKYKQYLLTKDGFTLYMFNIQGYNDFKMAYINKFNEMEEQLKSGTLGMSQEEKLVLDIYKGGAAAVVAIQKLAELKTKPLLDEIDYKEDVIVGLVDNITLKDKRQILNQVVRHNGSNFQERWKLLYYEFDKKYHINTKRRLENYNKSNSPKMKSKLDYIEKVMDKLPALYEIAAKIFETDVKEIVKQYKSII